MSEDPAEQKARDDHDRELWIDEQAYRNLKRMLDNNEIDLEKRKLPEILKPKYTDDFAKAFCLAMSSNKESA